MVISDHRHSDGHAAAGSATVRESARHGLLRQFQADRPGDAQPRKRSRILPSVLYEHAGRRSWARRARWRCRPRLDLPCFRSCLHRRIVPAQAFNQKVPSWDPSNAVPATGDDSGVSLPIGQRITTTYTVKDGGGNPLAVFARCQLRRQCRTVRRMGRSGARPVRTWPTGYSSAIARYAFRRFPTG